MFQWITDNAVTIIALAVILILVAVAIISLRKDKKKSGGCTGNCANCGMCNHNSEK